MQVDHLFMFTLGESVPLGSAYGIFTKYSARGSIKSVRWFHISKSPKKDLKIYLIGESGKGLGLVDYGDPNAGVSIEEKDKSEFDKLEKSGNNVMKDNGVTLGELEGVIGAIVISHGCLQHVNGRNPDVFAYILSEFRSRFLGRKQFSKIVFDVCNLGVLSSNMHCKLSKDVHAKFAVKDGSNDSVDPSEMGDLKEQEKLNFLQCFLANYGKATGEFGSVRVAGWDCAVSVYHPSNDLVVKSKGGKNPDVLNGLVIGQKFLLDGADYRKITEEERKKHKRMYQYVAFSSGESVIYQLMLEGWTDKITH